jgi:cold shock CspA family protein
VDQVCTVGRTLESGTEVSFEIVETDNGGAGAQ